MNSRNTRNNKGNSQGKRLSSYDEADRLRSSERSGSRSRSKKPRSAIYAGENGNGKGAAKASGIRYFFSRLLGGFLALYRKLPWVVSFCFCLAILRLAQLQIFMSDYLTNYGEQQSRTNVTILAKRGTIYDRNGNVLAMDVERQNISCNTNAINLAGKDADDSASKAEAKERAANILAQYLGEDVQTYRDLFESSDGYALIKKNVDNDIADEIHTEFYNQQVDGVYFDDTYERVYPYGSVAGQILGFVKDDGEGISGLELYYNDTLKGTNGTKSVVVGRYGQVAGSDSVITSAENGSDIVTSLDVNIQQMAEEQLVQGVADTNSESGNVMVTDPSTGEILAACSLPLYDPGERVSFSNEALKLTSVSDSYEPGSTFKILTMAIGYESGTINQNSTFTVPPEVQVGDDMVSDSDGRDYTMGMTPSEIMKRSSNTGAALVGMAIGADTFSEGIARFGIGSLTGIDFPGEVSGLVTSRDDYTGATLGSMAFGQGLSFPSIQLVRAVGAVANKGVMLTPHFAVQIGGETLDWGEGDQVVSQETAEMVTDDMRLVVNDDEGTGRRARISGYDVAGKTGTGEMASSEGGYQEDNFMSSFIGFANASDADVLVYVGLYGTAQHGGTAAAPIFSAIMSEALTDLGVQAVD